MRSPAGRGVGFAALKPLEPPAYWSVVFARLLSASEREVFTYSPLADRALVLARRVFFLPDPPAALSYHAYFRFACFNF
jgi:hypothetical protein